MNKYSKQIINLVRVLPLYILLMIYGCNNFSSKIDKNKNYTKALVFLFEQEQINFELDNHNDKPLHIFLISSVGCPTCHRKFLEYLDNPLKPNTIFVSGVDLPYSKIETFKVDDDLLRKVNLKTDLGLVYVEYQNEVKKLIKIDALNVDSIFQAFVVH